MIPPADQQIINAFLALYCGALAEKRRAAGDGSAMPPWAEVFWLGKQVVKNPVDLWTYQEIIVETKPDVILETGASGGGSAFFFATICDLIGHGEIVTVDTVTYPELWRPHPRIRYLTGDSTSGEIAEEMRKAAAGRRTMVSLDSLHLYEHVTRELAIYAPLVSPGCYLVIEDTGIGDGPEGPDAWAGQHGPWADSAAREFARAHPEFTVDLSREKHLLTSNHRGWLRRRQ